MELQQSHASYTIALGSSASLAITSNFSKEELRADLASVIRHCTSYSLATAGWADT